MYAQMDLKAAMYECTTGFLVSLCLMVSCVLQMDEGGDHNWLLVAFVVGAGAFGYTVCYSISRFSQCVQRRCVVKSASLS